MSPVTLTRLYALLDDAEGRQRRPYSDSRGFLTLGVGHRCDGGAIPLTDKAIDAILEGDVEEMVRRCERRISSWATIDEIRQATLIELAFNGTLFASPKALEAIEAGDWNMAVRELLDGPWAEEVGPRRSRRLMAQLRTGQWV